jgi:hypothetical protein
MLLASLTVLKTWKEVCFACVDAEEFRLAQICGLNIIVQVYKDTEIDIYSILIESFSNLLTSEF